MNTENTRTVSLAEIIDMGIHPVADLFPMLPEEVRKDDGKQETLTLPELADSILENGLQEPIVLYQMVDLDDPVILDGRNRRAACLMVVEALGETPKDMFIEVEDFVGTEEEAQEYILALNIDRRDLTPGQRAFVADGYWEYRNHGGDRKTESSSNLNLNVHELAQRFRVSTGYIVEARKISRQIETEREQANDAAQEAERQRDLAELKRVEIEAAKAADDSTKATEASIAANRASIAAAEAAEKAAEKANQAAAKESRVDKVKSGTASMGSLVKETKAEPSDTEPTVKFRNKLNAACTNVKAAISELAKADSGEDNYLFIGRRLNELAGHFESEFGVTM